MRFAPLILCVSALACAPALGASPSAPPETRQEPAPERAPPTLDELFARLAGSGSSPAGKAVEAEILTRFNQSGSDTADLLLSWAAQSIEAKKFPRALDILDQIIVLQPRFAEAWNKRATVNFLLDDYAASLSDIRQALALEPRHFGALSGLGMMLQAMNRKQQAIEVYERALAIDPQLQRVKEALEALQKEAAGRAT